MKQLQQQIWNCFRFPPLNAKTWLALHYIPNAMLYWKKILMFGAKISLRQKEIVSDSKKMTQNFKNIFDHDGTAKITFVTGYRHTDNYADGKVSRSELSKT